jgi:hypothetical protein
MAPQEILKMIGSKNHKWYFSRLWLSLAVGLVLLAVGAFVDRHYWSAPEVTPESDRMGWDPVAAARDAPIAAALMPKFEVRDPKTNQVVTGVGKNAEMWKYSKIANGGKNVPALQQETGDCVPHGAARAFIERTSYQIVKEGRNEVLKIPFPSYIYGIARIDIAGGRQGTQQGAAGIWAVQGMQALGVLTFDQAEKLGYKYSGKLSDLWGLRGVPQAVKDVASKFRIRTYAQIKTWADVRDALVNGYPVTVASNVGFKGASYVKDGKRWLQPAGVWKHQMCFIGCEDRVGRAKGAYCMNSWGADAHEKPMDDEPPGGFWVDWQTVQRMVSQGDSWAFTDSDGFPADASASWDAFSADALELAEETGDESLAAAVVAADTPEPITIREVRKSWSEPIGYTLLGASLGALAAGCRRRRLARCASSQLSA